MYDAVRAYRARQREDKRVHAWALAYIGAWLGAKPRPTIERLMGEKAKVVNNDLAASMLGRDDKPRAAKSNARPDRATVEDEKRKFREEMRRRTAAARRK